MSAAAQLLDWMPDIHGARPLSGQVRLSYLLMISAVFFIVLVYVGNSLASPGLRQESVRKAHSHSAQHHAVKHEAVEGVEIVWQGVPSPKGILMLFHGCRHSATDYFPKSDSCPACLGLPEERRMAQAALKRGYIPLAFSSAEREDMQCWDVDWPPESSPDINRVTKAMQALQQREGWEGLPLYGLGISSGGAMVLLLAHMLEIQGVCSQIMGVPPSFLASPPQGKQNATRPYPPTMFVHMARDESTSRAVQADMEQLHKLGVAAANISVSPVPVTPTFLSERIADLSKATSKAIHQALRDARLLDADGMLVRDPRRSEDEWQAAVMRVPAAADQRLEPDRSPIHEALNVAWAQHEAMGDYMDKTFMFWSQSQGVQQRA